MIRFICLARLEFGGNFYIKGIRMEVKISFSRVSSREVQKESKWVSLKGNKIIKNETGGEENVKWETSVEKSWNTFHSVDFNQLTGHCTENLLHDKHLTRCSWEAQKRACTAYRGLAFRRHDGKTRQICKFLLTLNTIFKELLDTRLASMVLFPL